MTVRNPAVAGLFYEAAPPRLRQHVQELLDAAQPSSSRQPRGLIVPHAGYIYSGALAAAAYRHLQSDGPPIRRVALLGPAHRVYLRGMALSSAQAFATPLGEVALDPEAVNELAGLPEVAIADEAHLGEHSLEVHLPFLQVVLDEFTLVPIVVGECPPCQVAAVIDRLWQDPATLLVASTDLSHFLSYEEARRRDAATCDRILAREAALSGEDACGARVLNGLLSSDHCREMDLELVGLCNSGDTAGSRDRVVGYGAFLVH